MCQLARKDCFYFVAYVKYGYRWNIIQIRKRSLFIYPFDPSFNSQLEVELSVSVQFFMLQIAISAQIEKDIRDYKAFDLLDKV